MLGLPGWFVFFLVLFFLGGGAAAPGAAVEFCCREEEPACGCICVSPSPKKGADEAAAIGTKERKHGPAAAAPLAHSVDQQAEAAA